MACGCVIFECLRVPFDPCNAGFEIDVVATETGNASIEVLFNENIKQFEVAITEGENIILPTSAFNENYTHEVEITQGGESTCYKLTTIPASGLPDFTPVPPENALLYTTLIAVTDTTLQSSSGETIISIMPGNQDWVVDVDFTQSGTTITIINGSTVSIGTVYSASYVNS